MTIHFIAIGGAAMHNLAIALHKKGHVVSGSDDEINEPSRSRLAGCGLLPSRPGWHPGKITGSTDCVIVGMHAGKDNPELIEAQKLGIRIFSYPEYLYDQTKNKTRVVISGSHGKTTITSMIMHVLKQAGRRFDFMVGSVVEGFDIMVGLDDDAPTAVFEGDEYLASPVDPRPKFLIYRPHIGLISGVAWDHVNVFPTREIYKEQFEKFIDHIEPEGTLVYFEDDDELVRMAGKVRQDIVKIPYGQLQYDVVRGTTVVRINGESYPLKIFGAHNIENLSGAREVCNLLGISDEQFFSAVCSFTGSGKRLQELASNGHNSIYVDFAHSPSKLVATINAVKSLYPGRELIACFELHTYSSLTGEYLEEYAGTMDAADTAIVYYHPDTLKHKKLKPLTGDDVRRAFKKAGLEVFTSANSLHEHILSVSREGQNLLMMSSGNFSGMDIEKLAAEILNKQ